MKPLLLISCIAPALAGLAAADDPDAVVRFTNSDRLAGSVVSLTNDTLVWKSSVLRQPTPFFLRRVMDISLPSNDPNVAAEHEATLKLTNGDTVCGQLASVTDESITLDTWYAGRMNFNRLMVSDVKIAASSSFVYRGPNGMEGWKPSPSNKETPVWTYARGALRSSGSGGIAREDLLPEECSISFDLAWKGDSISLKLLVFTMDGSTDNPSSGYEFQFQRGSIQLRNCKARNYIMPVSSQVLMEAERAHIEIKLSSKSGVLNIYVNDRLIGSMNDTDVAKGKFGRCLQFVSQTPSPQRISGIKVAQWDGVSEATPEQRAGMMRGMGMGWGNGFGGMNGEEPKPATPDKSKEGRMELANGDSLMGDVTSVTDGMVSVKTPLGDVKMPVSRIRSVPMKKADLERCIRRNGDIRAWFGDGNSIVFRLDGVGEGTLIGSSQNFGKATFKLSAFNRIEFNIHDPELEDKRVPEDW